MDEAMAPFLSTPSARRATAGKQEDGVVTHISIPALREEGDGKPHRGDHGHSGISIPALREEGDRFHSGTLTAYRNFYPRPPRGGRRRPLEHLRIGCSISIPALREEGDRAPISTEHLFITFLSPPSARRATYFFFVPNRLVWISIPALREEGDHPDKLG